MKKIIFVDIPMRKNPGELNYANTGNVKSDYDVPVVYAVVPFLLRKIKNGDSLKIVMLKTKKGAPDDYSDENADKLQVEIKQALKNYSVSVDYITIQTDFDESKENQEIRFRKMLDVLEQGAELYSDITFGPRIIPMVLMCVFNFAERFFDCRIKGIIYGKALYDADNKAYGGELFDVSPLYYLNGLTNSMEAPSGKDAIKAIDEFFAL